MKRLFITLLVALPLLAVKCGDDPKPAPNPGTGSGTGTTPTTPTTPTNVTVPTLTTVAVTRSTVTATTALSGGNITSDGGAPVTARGVCWSTSSGPTIANSKTSDGAGLGSFSSSLAGLTPATGYYARAYATNSAGTGYGDEIVFPTNPATTPSSSITLTDSKGDPVGGNIGFAFNGTASSGLINVLSSDSWTVKNNTSWLTVTPKSGTSNGKVTLALAENATTSSRYDVITFTTSKGATQTVDVTQDKKSTGASTTTSTTTGGGTGNGCEWCSQPASCVDVKAWRSGTGSCNLYTKVTNKTSRTITYQVCVQLANGKWDCGIDDVGAGKEGPTIYYCNTGSNPQIKYWVAYGNFVSQQCKFPNP